MSATPADLLLNSRWILPMTAPDELLHEHSLLIRDGRILDILPRLDAERRYAPRAVLDRPDHVLIPGLVGARTDTLMSAPPDAGAAAALLRGGVTCFATLSRDPAQAARVAVEQGMRIMLGLPVAGASHTGDAPGEQITRALAVRDVHKTHPLVSTAFAPEIAADLNDAVFERIATLVDELDCPLLVSLHASAAEIGECMARHHVRPIERLQRLGWLTPSLNAAHMAHLDSGDFELALQGGISIALCPSSDLEQGSAMAPFEKFTAHRMRLGLGGDLAALDATWDPWVDLKLLDWFTPPTHRAAGVSLWNMLAAATIGGAAALGLDHEIGTLQAGKWADLCCIDLRGPSANPLQHPISHLVRSGGCERIADVWIAGRQLLSQGLFTRFTRN